MVEIQRGFPFDLSGGFPRAEALDDFGLYAPATCAQRVAGAIVYRTEVEFRCDQAAVRIVAGLIGAIFFGLSNSAFTKFSAGCFGACLLSVID